MTSTQFVSYYGGQWGPISVWAHVQQNIETYRGLEQHKGEQISIFLGEPQLSGNIHTIDFQEGYKC